MKCPNCGLGCMVDIVVPKYKARLKGIDFEVIDAKIKECQWCSEELHHAKEIKRWYQILEEKLAERSNMIEIIIKGAVGSGKTTTGQLIEKALKAEGLTNITVTDVDNEKLPTMAYFQARTKGLREKNTKFQITMVQTKREK